MRAIIRTTSKGADVHSGGYAPTTAAEKNDQETDHAYEDRLVELRTKALFALGRNEDVSKVELLQVVITQIGKDGFHWKHNNISIPRFEQWGQATRLENERIFNART